MLKRYFLSKLIMSQESNRLEAIENSNGVILFEVEREAVEFLSTMTYGFVTVSPCWVSKENAERQTIKIV